jgi:hypothetical protein
VTVVFTVVMVGSPFSDCPITQASLLPFPFRGNNVTHPLSTLWCCSSVKMSPE